MVKIKELGKDSKLTIFTIALVGSLGLSGCASAPSSREQMDAAQLRSRAKSAAYGSEHFYLDYRSPEDRAVENHEFYFKHCELVSRRRFPSRTEYECTDPK